MASRLDGFHWKTPCYANITSKLILLKNIECDPRICIVRGRHRLLISAKNVNFSQPVALDIVDEVKLTIHWIGIRLLFAWCGERYHG
jgi:hypothetical protein